jgi:hypothetical protein
MKTNIPVIFNSVRLKCLCFQGFLHGFRTLGKVRTLCSTFAIVALTNIAFTQSDVLISEDFDFSGIANVQGTIYFLNGPGNQVDIFNDWSTSLIWSGPWNVEFPYNNLGWVNVAGGLPVPIPNTGLTGSVMYASSYYIFNNLFNQSAPQILAPGESNFVRTILSSPSFDPSNYDEVTLEFATSHLPGTQLNFSDTCIIALWDGSSYDVIDFYIQDLVQGVQVYDLTPYVNALSNNHQILFQYSGVYPFAQNGWAIDNVVITGMNYVPGCTNEIACNYSPSANEDDGSCILPDGCTSLSACNYSPTAQCDDGSCVYLSAPGIFGASQSTENDIENYSTSFTIGSIYEWVVTNGSILGGQGTSSIQVIWNDPGMGSISVAEINSDGCTSTQSILNVQVDCLVNAEIISGETSPELELEYNYSVDGALSSTYTWSVTNGIIVSGQGTSSVNVIWAAEGEGILSVIETTSTGCESPSITLTINATVSSVREIRQNKIHIYPNPARDIITLQCESVYIGASYSILDISGRLLNTGLIRSTNMEIELPFILAGTYILRVKEKYLKITIY